MDHLQMNVQNIIDGQGVGIALTGMLIVFAALAAISAFIGVLPRVLRVVAVRFPETHQHGAPRSASPRRGQPEDAGSGDASIVAAIGFALHTARQRQASRP